MSFARDLDRFRLKVDAAHSDSARGVALELFRSVIMDSPVDTGRFRGNWQASLQAPATNELERLDLSGGAAIGAMQGVVTGWNGTGVVFMANNLPYAQRLEYGWSKQAPQGMVRKNVARIQSIVERQARKHKV